MWGSPERLLVKWVRIAPHIIDTVLFVSGISLIIITNQYPLQESWLLAKLVALVAYIGLGTLALKRAPTKGLKLLFLFLAIATFAYIASTALTRDHIPWSGAPFQLTSFSMYHLYTVSTHQV